MSNPSLLGAGGGGGIHLSMPYTTRGDKIETFQIKSSQQVVIGRGIQK